MSAGRVQLQIRTVDRIPSTSTCNRCRCVIVRENVPWNQEWRCNGEHKRCTMIGCVPVLK